MSALRNPDRTPEFEEIRRLADQAVAESDRTQRAHLLENTDFPAEAFLWMALAPPRTWTLQRASACEFPTLNRDVRATLELMREKDFIIYRAPFYNIDPSLRPLILEEYVNRNRFDAIREALGKIGRGLLRITADSSGAATRSLDGVAISVRYGTTTSDQSQTTPATLPYGLLRWAQLAAEALNGSEMVNVLDRGVDEAMNQRQPSEILNWINACRPLAALLAHDLDRTLELGLQRTVQRLELLYRIKSDEQHLGTFLKRREQLDAVMDLLDGPEDLWALHVIGVGGVGKTALMSYVTSKLSSELPSSQRLATARIDFDYLNADYPRRAPGLLLWSFGQELRAYDTTQRARHSFDEADSVLRKLHQTLASNTDPSTRGTDQPLFQAALNLYIEGLRNLNCQVVLILDTCEELSKVTPEGGAPENVTETFRILRALHDGPQTLRDNDGLDRLPPTPVVPKLRVIFSGRRLLAGSGNGWHSSVSSLPGRPYMRLHELRGFTHGEAREFLVDVVKVGDAYVQPIIERSTPEVARVTGTDWDVSSSQPELPRANPFELKLYADWAKEDNPPDPETIRTASNSQYVEQRILRRLGFEASDELLQSLALLGHFDRKTLNAIAGSDESDVVWEKLEEQEWIEQRLEAVNDGKETRRVLTVDAGVRRRLLEYFRNRWGLSSLWHRAADYLEQVTLNDSLSSLGWYTFDAALRVIEIASDGSRVARWWAGVEKRILDERDFNWARDVIGYLQGNDGAARAVDSGDPLGGPESRMRPAVLATYAVALLRSNQPGQIASIWEEVWQKADNHPGDEDSRRSLKLRATAGRVAGSRSLRALPKGSIGNLRKVIHDFVQPDGYIKGADASNLAAALVGAIDSIVEGLTVELQPASRSFVETAAQVDPPTTGDSPNPNLRSFVGPDIGSLTDSAIELAEALERDGPISFSAFTASLITRLYSYQGKYDEAKLWSERAVRLLDDVDSLQPTTSPDWVPPQDLRSRVRLEYIRAAYPAFASAEEALQATRGRQAAITLTDSERLLSARLRLKNANRVPGATEYEPLLRGDPLPLSEQSTDEKSTVPPEIPSQQGLSSDFTVKVFPALCGAHRDTPPLAVTAAEIMAGSGDVDRAIAILRSLSDRVNEIGLGGALQAQAALARIAIRMRLYDEVDNLKALAESSQLDYLRLIWTREAFRGSSARLIVPDPAPSPDSIQAVWQTRFTGDETHLKAALTWAQRALPQSDGKVETGPLSLDACEAALLERTSSSSGSALSPARAKLRFDPLQWWNNHRSQPETALRYWLRSVALTCDPDSKLDASRLISFEDVSFGSARPPSQTVIAGEIVSRLGTRRAAEIAFEEGDLLSLRLPERATTILNLARYLFSRAEDDVNALLSGGALALIHARRWHRAALDEVLEGLAKTYPRVKQRNPSLPDWSELQSGTVHVDQWPVGWRPWLVRLMVCMAYSAKLRDPKAGFAPALFTFLAGLPPNTKIPTSDENLALPADVFDSFEFRREPWGGVVNLHVPAQSTRWYKTVGYGLAAVAVFAAALAGTDWFLRFSAHLLMDGGRVLHFLADTPLDIRVFRWFGQLVYVFIVLGLIGWGLESRVASAMKYVFYLFLTLFGAAGMQYFWLSPKPVPRSGFSAQFDALGRTLAIAVGKPAFWSAILGACACYVLLKIIALATTRAVFTVRRESVSPSNVPPPPGISPPLRLSLTASSPELMFGRSLASERVGIWKYLPTVRRRETELATATFQPPAFINPSDIQQALPDSIKVAFARLSRKLVFDLKMNVAISPENGLHDRPWELLIARTTNSSIQDPRSAFLRFRREAQGRRSALVARRDVARVLTCTTSPVDTEVARRAWRRVQQSPQFNYSSYVGPGLPSSWSPVDIVHLCGTVEDTSVGAAFRSAYTSDQFGLESPITAAASQSDDLISAQRLVSTFGSLSFCILQAPVQSVANDRSETDRRRAGLARVFAAQLFAQGVAVVVTLPSLDEQRAAAALERLTAMLLSRSWFELQRGENAVAAMQHVIVTMGLEPSDTKLELAFEACLYCDPDWRPNKRKAVSRPTSAEYA